jgi:hypothetical protein
VCVYLEEKGKERKRTANIPPRNRHIPIPASPVHDSRLIPRGRRDKAVVLVDLEAEVAEAEVVRGNGVGVAFDEGEVVELREFEFFEGAVGLWGGVEGVREGGEGEGEEEES